MAVLHKKVDAMLLESDGIWVRFGYALNDLNLFNIQFVASGSSFVCSDLASHDDGGFLG